MQFLIGCPYCDLELERRQSGELLTVMSSLTGVVVWFVLRVFAPFDTGLVGVPLL